MIPRLAAAHADLNLHESALRVYLALVFDEDFRLSPGEFRSAKHAALAKRLKMGERTLDRAMADLIRWGYIQAGKRVPGSPQRYKLVYDDCPAQQESA